MSTPASNDAQVRVMISHRIWEVTTFLVLTGGMLAGGGWFCVAYADTDKLALLPSQTNALVFASVVYTNIAAIAVFGLGSLYGRDPTMLGLYSVLLWNHFVLSLLSGGLLLYTMLQSNPLISDGSLNDCLVLSDDIIAQVFCEYNFNKLQNIIIGTTIAMWIIQFAGCIMASRFISLVSKEEDESSAYPGPEVDVVWVPQTPLSGYTAVPVDVQADGEEEEYKTPVTARFSRFSWV
ncbi:hypothetical protein K488DRAFT_88480 [Vararia minispora EC-137]|uniref:Uncharacterized protein n=1 Tax=Vararia minispora EC-137 TaxID=1314806 RepID=A0ACB8QD22_9AGAM|nr:hypothetical protein K488DRAFT_88480 [Vararia minispora EC-137]